MALKKNAGTCLCPCISVSVSVSVSVCLCRFRVNLWVSMRHAARCTIAV